MQLYVLLHLSNVIYTLPVGMGMFARNEHSNIASILIKFDICG